MGTVRGSFGLIIGRDTDDYSAPNMAMEQREHDDWLAYLPWRAGVPGANTYSPDIHHDFQRPGVHVPSRSEVLTQD